MRSNGNRAGEWSDAEYARRKRVAKATGINAGYLATLPASKQKQSPSPAKSETKQEAKMLNLIVDAAIKFCDKPNAS